jgi:acyl transferase domain-containing protein
MNHLTAEPVAIVGIGCRFPKANGPNAFWRLLVAGVDAISEVPPDRFDICAFYDQTPGVPGKVISRFGGFVEGIDLFDASFFGIAPREAEAMDPQQRVLLEIAYEAMEDAGLPQCVTSRSDAGVFVGIMSDDYAHQVYSGAADLDLTMATGVSRATAAARISRVFGFQGPSLTIDTDRASSLTAVHLACRSLRTNECSLALAAASNLILGPEFSIACSRSGILSPDGRCKFCDVHANGIARSDGFGVLVLKRMGDALRDGSNIYALIRGSAVTNNGSTSEDLVRPSVQAQTSLLRAALRDANICPAEIAYLEAHGTGTRVGDQAEVEALASVFAEGRPAGRPLLIGSVKTNIGHAEGAAGMAGIIKVALALRHGAIPASLHCETPNPELGLEGRSLAVQAETGPWPATGSTDVFAGVSAFGFTGTLAHIVLQAPPSERPNAQQTSAHRVVLLPLSARSERSLEGLAEAYRKWLEGPTAPESLAHVCYSASLSREHHAHRLSLVASSRTEMIQQLDAFLTGTGPYSGAFGHVAPGTAPKLAFVFPGQGGQWAGMGRELFAGEPVFRNVIEVCDDAVRAEAGWSVAELLRGDASANWLQEIDYVQPTLTAVMIGLAELWRSWGIEPNAVLGFSMGEAAAACVAGVLDVPDTMAVICRRTRLMKRLSGKGAIASVPLTVAEAENILLGRGAVLSVAVVAAPGTTVLSGDPSALRDVVDELENRGLSCHYVKADVASHSGQMECLLDELRAGLAHLNPRRGSIPLISTVYDAHVGGEELDAEYWARNLRQPVLQMNGIARLVAEGFKVFLEIGPHPIAVNALLETIRHYGSDARAVASLRRNETERECLLKSLGALYASGVSPEWAKLFVPGDQRFVSLPTYAWDRKRYWFETTDSKRLIANDARRAATTATAPNSSARRSRVWDELHAAPSGQRPEILLDYFQRRIGAVLKISDAAAVDRNSPLRQMGLTSLMATELAAELERALRFPCSATLFFNYPTLEQIVGYLLSQGVGESSAGQQDTTGKDEPSAGKKNDESEIARSTVFKIPATATYETNLSGEGAASAAPIAIIGLGCRFPGSVAGPDDYWRILRGGVDTITEVPADRWNIDDWYDPNSEAPGKMYTRWGGFLDSIDKFDAAYFGISPREAEVLDPQQRLLLEVTVEALEHAGYAPASKLSQVGVFVGIMNNNDFVSLKGISSHPARVNAHDSTGHATSAAAGRLSYALGFHGPSVAIDTACSSSLVAIHLACQALRSGDCQFAVAGGVNIILAPEVTISFCKTRMLSPTGKCRTFDARADGYVRGEGCGMIVLKPFSDALRDKDNILAVICGSAVNQDGRSSSLTAPNGLAQQAVIRQALQRAGVAPSEVDYVEAHGTGTALGDPIEVEALGAVVGEHREATRPVLIGSVKTNIGHLESAAGVAGLIKVILSLQNQEIPPHLHLEQVNPRISLTAANAAIPTRPTPWPRGKKRRVAGISSFGFVGTNAHVVVEEAPERTNSDYGELPRPVHRLLALSARTPMALTKLAARYGQLLSRKNLDMDDVCHTANLGRIHHPVRAAFVAANEQVLRAKIHAFLDASRGADAPAATPPLSSTPKVGFLFTGQGAQYPLMGLQLYEAEPVFQGALARCAEIMDPMLQRSLLAILRDEDPAILGQTRFAQPALFALEYALLQQWRAWGIEPSVVMGHSLGEYTAAVTAGVLAIEEAARLVVARGCLMHSIKMAGGSAAVFAGEEVVRPFVEPHLDSISIAADNAPERVLISGEANRLEIICSALQANGIEVRKIIGLVAAHSPLMDPILDTFETIAGTATYRPATLPIISTRTGCAITDAEIGRPLHWRNLIRDKVRFREGMNALYAAGCRVFVEIGPRHTLSRLGGMCLPFPDIVWLPSLSKERHDQEQMLESLAALYLRGFQVRWEERHRPFEGRRVALPTTVFEEKRFWPDGLPLGGQQPASVASDGESSDAERWLGRRLVSPLPQIQFEARVDTASMPMLKDHHILDALIVSAAAQLVRVLTAAELLMGCRRLEIREALFPQPLLLIEDTVSRLSHLVLTPEEGGYEFHISSTSSEANAGEGPVWQRHTIGRVAAAKSGGEEPWLDQVSRQDLMSANSQAELAGKEFYAAQTRAGYALGPSFQWIERVWLGEREAVAKLRRPDGFSNSWPGIHPGLIDSCLQIASRLVSGGDRQDDPEDILVPSAVESVRYLGEVMDRSVDSAVYAHVCLLPASPDGDVASRLAIFHEDGAPILSISKVYLRRLSRHDLHEHRENDSSDSLRRVAWRESALANGVQSAACQWLILADEAGTGAALADLLRSRRQTVVLAYRVRNDGNSDDRPRVNPADRTALESLVASLWTEGQPHWRGIVYLWGLDSGNNQEVESHSSDRETNGETDDCLALFSIAKLMISGMRGAHHPALWVVTRGAQRTQRESRLGVKRQALLWGLGRVIANEHASLFGGLIDLDPHANGDDIAELADELLARDIDTQVAYRGGKRLVPRLTSLDGGRPRGRAKLRTNASYLITGAFGSLGREVTESLVNNGARHLALLGRHVPNEAALEWVSGLRARGVEVLVLRADVSRFDELAEALAQLEHTMPALGGVVHAAGVVEDALLSKLEWPSFERVLAPKVQGSWNLHRLTNTRPLDFWVIFSSVSALIGIPGQAAYAAGNAYADAVVHHRRMEGSPGLSINWGPWRGDGMSREVIDDLLRRWGLLGIDPEKGSEMFAQLLGIGSAQVWAAPIEAHIARARMSDSPHLSFLAGVAGVGENTSRPRRDGTAPISRFHLPEQERHDAVLQHVVDVVRNVTAMNSAESVRVDTRFDVLGIDSLLSLDLIEALEASFEITLPSTIFMDCPTIDGLVGYVCDEISRTMAVS